MLPTLLQDIITTKINTWEKCPPHVDLAYSFAFHYSTKFSTFKIVYGFNTLTSLNLSPSHIIEHVNVDVKKKV